ncbi:MAG TPA: sugar phosphate isomerase/epimerase [Puia sp.]|nr:sugar phosphate isomerase/epimerase [Puia sp.]
MTSRRKFLQSGLLGMMGLPVMGEGMKGFPVMGGGGMKGLAAMPLDTLQLGIAGYSFLHVPMDAAIAMMNRVGVSNLSIKDFFLPLDSPPDTIHAVNARFQAAGIRIYAAGVIYMKTPAEVDRAFDYARVLGIGLIVAAPNPELLPQVEEKVKASGIRVAIHNHGPEDKLYPSPVDVWEHVKGLDERIGLCLDVGHAARAGADIVKVVNDYAPRIFDLHIKDLKAISRQAQPIELGRGVLDIPGLLRALIKNRYAGVCSIEHEMDMNDPMPGIAESAGFFRGVVRTIGNSRS